MTFITALIGATLGLVEPTLDGDELGRVLEAAWSPLRDFSLEYEGVIKAPSKAVQERIERDLGSEGVYDTFSGLYLRRSDGASLVDIFHRFAPENSLSRQTIATIRGRREEFFRTDNRLKGGEIQPESFAQQDLECSYGRIFLYPFLRGLLSYPKTRAIREEAEDVHGHRCEVVSFPIGPQDHPEKGIIYRFWIDLDRGGNVLKRETTQGGGLFDRTSGIELKRFDAGGVEVWLPIRGVHEVFDGERVDKVFRPNGEMNTVESYYLISGSARFNTGPPDARFSVNFKDGTMITDRLRKVQYEFGQDRRPPPTSRAESEERLEEHLAKADAQGDELQAMSRARAGAGWTAWVPWVTSLVAVVALAAVWLQRRRG